MKLFFCVVLSFFASVLYAQNLSVNAQLFTAPASRSKKNVNLILKDPQTQKLFSAEILCLPGAASSVSLKNHFEFLSSGFHFQTTPARSSKNKKTVKINAGIDWIFPAEGPFHASGSESFYEGTVIHCARSILPDVFSPLGINQSKNAEIIYVPAMKFSRKKQKKISIFQSKSKWKIKIKVQEAGQAAREVETIPYYHSGRFPAKNPVGIDCRIYNYRGISVLNMYYVHQRGLRKNGKPVTEELDLTLCFAAPEKGKETLLADVTSFCFSDRAAFSKLPAKGGKPIRYQVFLTVK